MFPVPGKWNTFLINGMISELIDGWMEEGINE